MLKVSLRQVFTIVTVWRGMDVPEDLLQEVRLLVLRNDIQTPKWMEVKGVNRMKMKQRRVVLLTCISKVFHILNKVLPVVDYLVDCFLSLLPYSRNTIYNLFSYGVHLKCASKM